MSKETALQIHEGLTPLFKSVSVEQLQELPTRCGRAYHFGLIERTLETMRASTLFVEELMLQDIIYRYATVLAESTSTARWKYAVLRDETDDKLLRSLSLYVKSLINLRPLIEQKIIQVYPHPTMFLSQNDIRLATELSNEFGRLAERVYAFDRNADRLINMIAIGAEKFNAIPFTNWSQGLRQVEEKMRLVLFLKELKKPLRGVSGYLSEYDALRRKIDEGYKLSLIPALLSRFEFVKEFVDKHAVSDNYSKLIQLREDHAEFRTDFFSMIDEVRKAKNKTEMKEIIDSVECDLRSEMKLAQKRVRFWRATKTISSLAATGLAYASLNVIGVVLGLPTLRDKLGEARATWQHVRQRPNQVVLMLKRMEKGDR